jgi:RDD family
MTLPRTTEASHGAVSLRARSGGYLVDMVIFAAIAMIVVVFAGFLLLATTDWAKKDPSDPQFYMFLAIIGLGAPLIWTALNLVLLVTRSQTGGQYVAGIRLTGEDGGPLSRHQAVAWWFSLNPLLFSWPMACVAGLPLAAVIALLLSRLTILVFGVLISLCVASPFIALVSAVFNEQHRAFHDRLAGVGVVPAG